jgi:hypothetical protein
MRMLTYPRLRRYHKWHLGLVRYSISIRLPLGLLPCCRQGELGSIPAIDTTTQAVVGTFRAAYRAGPQELRQVERLFTQGWLVLVFLALL